MIYFELFVTFFKIGLFTIGGGYAMLPLIQTEVLKNGWISDSDLLNFIAISESTPGPFAINIATFIGSEMAGIPGSVCTTFGVVLPSFIIILIVAHFYKKYCDSFAVKSVLFGLRPTVVGLIASAVVTTAFSSFFNSARFYLDFSFYVSIILCVIYSILAVKKVNPIIIIITSGVIGIAIGFMLNLPV